MLCVNCRSAPGGIHSGRLEWQILRGRLVRLCEPLWVVECAELDGEVDFIGCAVDDGFALGKVLSYCIVSIG
jgi:hypothetical protein